MNMKIGKILIASYFVLLSNISFSEALNTSTNSEPGMNTAIVPILNDYLEKNGGPERLSAISISISYPDNIIKNYFIGNISNQLNAPAINGNMLFQIGGLTKTFVTAIILQLEAEGALSLEQPLGPWFPEYPKWQNIKIKQLLNMTSGIPDYATIPELSNNLLQDLQKQWEVPDLINLAYQYPQPVTGFQFSNTNYLLAGLLIERVTKSTFKDQLKKRILDPFNFDYTYYWPSRNEGSSQLVRGYYYGQTLGKLMGGAVVSGVNMSLASEAGAMVSTSNDIVKWIHLLFSGKVFRTKQQLTELKALISTNSGQPVSASNISQNTAFGLGFEQGYDENMGTYWFAEGKTMGYRSLYLRTNCNQITVGITINSSCYTDSSCPDNSKEMLFKVYQSVLTESQSYRCKSQD